MGNPSPEENCDRATSEGQPTIPSHSKLEALFIQVTGAFGIEIQCSGVSVRHKTRCHTLSILAMQRSWRNIPITLKFPH